MVSTSILHRLWLFVVAFGLLLATASGGYVEPTTLSYEDIHDYDKSESFGISASYSGIAKPAGQGQSGLPGMIGFSYLKTDKRGVVRSTVSGAEVETIEVQDLSGLNRAMDRAREITRDKKTKVKLVVPIINPEGMANDWDAMDRAAEEIAEFFNKYIESGVFLAEGQSFDDIVNSVEFKDLADKIKQLPNPARARFAQKIFKRILAHGNPNGQDYGNCGLVSNQVFLYLMLSGQVITEKQLSNIGLSREIVMDEKKFMEWSIDRGYALHSSNHGEIGGTYTITRHKFFSDLGLGVSYIENPSSQQIIQAIRGNKGVQIDMFFPGGGHAVTAQQIYVDNKTGKTYVVMINSGWSPNNIPESATQAVDINDLMKMRPRLIITDHKLWGIHGVKPKSK